MTEAMFQKPNVKLIGYTQGEIEGYHVEPDAICAFGANSCRSEESTYDLILDAKKNLTEQEYQERKEHMFNVSVGDAHLAVLDQADFNFSIENLPRIMTLFLCEPEYLSHLQQSLRFVKAKRGYHLDEKIEGTKEFKRTKKVLDKSMLIYDEGERMNIKKEDARYIVPLGTITNITTKGPGRELTYLSLMAEQESVPRTIKDDVDIIFESLDDVAPLMFERRDAARDALSYMPSSQLFGGTNYSLANKIEKYNRPKSPVMTDSYGLDQITEDVMRRAVKERNMSELANLKTAGFTFLFPISLAGFHQATRQRRWQHTVEPIIDAVARIDDYEVPGTPNNVETLYSLKWRVPEDVAMNEYGLDRFNRQNQDMFDLFDETQDENVLPHSLIVFDEVNITVANMLNSFPIRTCETAQWEIRRLTNQMLDVAARRSPDYVGDVLKKYIGPRCKVHNICLESRGCKKSKKYKK